MEIFPKNLVELMQLIKNTEDKIQHIEKETQIRILKSIDPKDAFIKKIISTPNSEYDMLLLPEVRQYLKKNEKENNPMMFYLAKLLARFNENKDADSLICRIVEINKKIDANGRI